MSWLAFILLGLIAGLIAKSILPGRAGGGWVGAIVVGIVGALLGGWLGSVLFNADLQEFFSIQTWALALGGSLLVLLIWGGLTGRNARA